jgi:hypothetical protein
MKCDSWASFLACTKASPCLGYDPKAKVMTSFHPNNQGPLINIQSTHQYAKKIGVDFCTNLIHVRW